MSLIQGLTVLTTFENYTAPWQFQIREFYSTFASQYQDLLLVPLLSTYLHIFPFKSLTINPLKITLVERGQFLPPFS